jgi:hypothetical protein
MLKNKEFIFFFDFTRNRNFLNYLKSSLGFTKKFVYFKFPITIIAFKMLISCSKFINSYSYSTFEVTMNADQLI